MQPYNRDITMKNRGHSWLPRLSSMRVIIVLFIAMGYASTMPVGPRAQEIGSHLGYEPSWIGIQILFFFSGALALRSLQARRFGIDYLRQRFLNIFPLLTAFTLAAILVIYPLCAPDGRFDLETTTALLKYFALTITAIDPGQPLSGLLDNAPYACLIQGAIWTFRWGLAFHILTAVLGRSPSIIKPQALLITSMITTVVYGITTYLAVKNNWSDLIHAITALRLAYPFLIGMTVWAYRDKMPTSLFKRIAIICLCFAISGAVDRFGPWSPLIEIALCFGWGYSAWLIATSTTAVLSSMDNWPHISPAMYMANWPIAQLLLMQYPNISPMQLVMLSLLLTMLTAATVHYGVTRPLLGKITVQPARP